jgi:predicted cupin superfamily sugar epimerase
MQSADYWIEKLELEPLPEEGGMYRETYRSDEQIPANALPDRFAGDRCFSTLIYYLLRHPEFSAFHRLKQDEIWHFYEGNALSVSVLGVNGSARQVKMGRDLDAGETFQLVLRRGEIFAAAVDATGGYALIGCTVAPGFEFQDFELVDRHELLNTYPAQREWVLSYTRDAS